MKFLNRTYKFFKELSIMGNVGIQTESPTAKLDIDGDFKVGLLPDDTTGFTNVVVHDADGNWYKRDMGTLFPTDIKLESGSIDPVTNVMTLTLSNGTTHDIDLTDLVDIKISTLQDDDEDTKIFIDESGAFDVIVIESKGVNIANFTATNAEIKNLMKFEKGYAVAIRNVNTNTTLAATDHTLVVDTTVAGIVATLPEISTVQEGKVYELKITNQANGVNLVTSGTDTIKDANSYALNHSFLRVQANNADNEWVVLEEVRAGGFLVEETAPTSGTTRVYSELVGLDVSNFDFLRDGLVESAASEYTFDSATGTITVQQAFEGELLQLRLN